MSDLRVGDWVMVSPKSGSVNAMYGRIVAIENEGGRPIRFMVQTLREDGSFMSGAWASRNNVTSYEALKKWAGPHMGVEQAIKLLKEEVC